MTETTKPNNKKLIISTGDISDIDGFFAIAEYAKTGADVLFMMNYPAYIGTNQEEEGYECAHPGLGYKYSAKQVFDKVPDPAPQKYVDFLKQYEGLEGNELMKAAMTDLAFAMCRGVWSEASNERGALYFGIGGINAINPFSSTAIKNEAIVYSEAITRSEHRLNADEGSIYNMRGERHNVNLCDFDEIYVDFNGAMSFLNDEWVDKLNAAASRIQGAFIMGGVYAEQPPQTMPAIPNVLNRFSSATMNQLYHPLNSARFFQLIDRHSIPCYTVTNNVVADLTTFSDADKKNKTMHGIHAFLHSNAIDSPFLTSLADLYYTSRYSPPRKPFDFYTAAALRRQLQRRDLAGAPRRLYCSAAHGATLVSAHDTWEEALRAYVSAIDVTEREGDVPFVKAKKQNFRIEIEIMTAAASGESAPPPPPLVGVAVRDLSFALDPETKALSVASVAQTVASVAQTVESAAQSVASVASAAESVAQTVPETVAQTVASVAQTVASVAQTVAAVVVTPEKKAPAGLILHLMPRDQPAAAAAAAAAAGARVPSPPPSPAAA